MFVMLGFIISKFTQGSGYRKKLILQWNKYCYHIHHWMTFLFIVLVIHFTSIIPKSIKEIMQSFFIGVLLEDLTFQNIFVIKERCSIKEY